MKTNTIILDGKPVEANIFGDGIEQIAQFNTVAGYARSHAWKFNTSVRPSKFQGMVDTIVMGVSDKYQIIAIESHVPGTIPPLLYPRHQSYVQDKTNGQEITHYGTIAHRFWDLLHELKDKQK